MKCNLKRDMLRLGVTIGAFGGLAAMICLTGVTTNGHLTHAQFFVGMVALLIVVFGCVKYIDQHTEGGEWIE